MVGMPRAFMQIEMDELVHMQLTCTMVKLLLEIEQELYEDCGVYEKVEIVLYVEPLKALYGTIWVAWLFWEKLSL